MAEKKKPIAVQVEEKIGAVIGEMGYEIWDIFYGKEGQSLVLRITIDKEGGADLADCEYVHRAVLAAFDRDIEDYALTVGSAGISSEEADQMLSRD